MFCIVLIIGFLLDTLIVQEYITLTKPLYMQAAGMPSLRMALRVVKQVIISCVPRHMRVLIYYYNYTFHSPAS